MQICDLLSFLNYVSDFSFAELKSFFYVLMETNEKNLMRTEEFNSRVAAWTLKVREASKAVLGRTRGSGRLRAELKDVLLESYDKEEKAYVGLGFRFPRYGAFVEYGAGRGYVVKDGVVYRGFTDYIDKELRGLRVSKYTLQRRKHIVGMNVKRKPLPWLDPQIVGNIDDLADVAGEYYGDRALRSVLEKFNRITIRKSYGK